MAFAHALARITGPDPGIEINFICLVAFVFHYKENKMQITEMTMRLLFINSVGNFRE